MISHSRSRAFSLAEVALALGILSFALVGIFGLFGQSLRSNAETMQQVESTIVPGALESFLSNQTFSSIYQMVQASSHPEILAAITANGTCLVSTNTPSDLINRPGRLFRVILDVSPNVPLRNAAGQITNASPTRASLPASVASYTSSTLGIQARVHEVPSPGFVLSSQPASFIYDFAIAR